MTAAPRRRRTTARASGAAAGSGAGTVGTGTAEAPVLPGDGDAATRLERMIRVDQAGEFGARQIYRGQLDVLRGTAIEAVIQDMASQEDEHLAAFDRMLVERRIRPTALTPVWRVAGYALGAGTALLGERAAMACTVAVEEVIEGHYRRQIDDLGDREPELKKTLEQFRRDELHHRDTGLAHDAEGTPGYPLLSRAIRTGTKLAIWLSERV